jgi:hypothetical protein
MAIISIHCTLINVRTVLAIASEPSVAHAVVSSVEVGTAGITMAIVGIGALVEI